jgi:hypothetical protein
MHKRKVHHARNQNHNQAGKRQTTRVNRNSPEAAVEEEQTVWEEIGLSDEQIREREQPAGNPKSGPGPVPTDGS